MRNLSSVFVMAGLAFVVGILSSNAAEVSAPTGPNDVNGALRKAIQAGDLGQVESLIDKGAEVNKADESGYVPLVYAVWNDDPNVVKLLLNKDADPNARDMTPGFTVLHWAILMDNRGSVELLLAAGANVNTKSNSGETPLDVAAYGVSAAIGDLLVAKGAEVSSLHAAAYVGDLEKVKAFIAKGADANEERGMIQGTALHAAAAGARTEVVRYLISQGADVSAKNRRGQTPLDLAREAKQNDVIEVLLGMLDVEGLSDSLFSAVQSGEKELVGQILEHHANINVQDDFGLTPLHHAVAEGQEEVAVVLLEHKAAVDIQDNAGRTPMHYAVGAGRGLMLPEDWSIDIARVLLDYGADINAQDAIGWTPLYYLAISGDKRHHGAIEFLVQRGADLSRADKRGCTPYLWVNTATRYHESISGPEYRHPWVGAFSDTSELLRTLGNHDVDDSRNQGVVENAFETSVTGPSDAVRFVATSGRDSNPGTQELPFRTLPAALGTVGPNGVIIVRGGVYRCLDVVRFDKSGEPGRPIVVKAYPGEVPVLDFSASANNSLYSSLAIEGAYWHLEGLAIANGPQFGVSIRGKRAHHNILEKIQTYKNRFAGVALEKDATHNLLLNCDSFQNFDFHWNGENGDGFGAFWSVGQGNVLIGNRSWNNSDDGFDCWRSNAAVCFEECYAWNNGEDIWHHPFFTGNANGFKLGMGEGQHVLVECLAWGHTNSGFTLNGNTSGVILNNCCAWNNRPNYAFGWSGWSEEARKNSLFANSISYRGNSRDDIHGEAQSLSNSWDPVLRIQLADSDFLSLDDSMMSAPRNPDGSIPYNNFLRLAPGSAAIDAGTDVNMPYVGKAPDLGAFEYDPNENAENYVKMLHQYVRNHDIEKINELTDAGTDINEKDWLGYAPLHWACYFGYADLAELLIGKGADPTLISDTGRTPLEIVTSMQYDNIADLLRKSGSRQ